MSGQLPPRPNTSRGPSRSLPSAVAILSLAGMLLACGQRGPLYLPDDSDSAGRPPSRPAPAQPAADTTEPAVANRSGSDEDEGSDGDADTVFSDDFDRDDGDR